MTLDTHAETDRLRSGARRLRRAPCGLAGCARSDARGDSRPRVLSVRFGFNPNSSSLGIDISFLLLGLGGVSVLTAALSAWLGASARASPKPPEPAPAPEDDA